jgi:hypothetical protein
MISASPQSSDVGAARLQVAFVPELDCCTATNGISY